MKADLHVHSTLSDGSLSRREILEEARKRGITHIAFTEHDKIFSEEISAEGIEIISGVEISAWDPKTGRKAHVLGYGCRRRGAVKALAGPVLAKRHENCLKQIDVLKKLGYRVAAEDVLPYAAGGVIYKQHILRYLVDSGQSPELFGSIYSDIFKSGGPCDFDIQYADVRDAVQAICDDGGFAVLAHPGQQQNLDLVPELASLGLSGIELFHLANDEETQREVRRLAARFRLFCTGGSDFHGEYEKIKSPLGGFTAPEDCPLELLRDGR